MISPEVYISGNTLEFNFINVQAKKTSPCQYGRASGEIIILCNRKYFAMKELLRTLEFVFTMVYCKNVRFILGVVYRSPLANFCSFLNNLKNNLINLSYEFPSYPFVLGGDSNFRVSHLNQVNGELFYDSCFGANISSIHNVWYSESVIDLIWISLNGLNLFTDLNVLFLFTSSDHFPVILKFENPMAITNNFKQKKEFKLIFDKNKADEFYFLMESTFNPVWVALECDELEKILCTLLCGVAVSLNMEKVVGNKPFVSINKP